MMQTKIAVSHNDDKVYILDDKTTTLCHGHYKIDELKKIKRTANTKINILPMLKIPK